MRILHVGKYYYPAHGGIETVLRATAEGLASAGHEVKVLCFSPNWREEREEIEDVEVVRAPTYGSVMSQPICPSLRRLLLRESMDMDIVHFHSPNPLAEFAATKLPDETKVLTTYHADVTRQRALLPAYRPVIRRFLDRCDRIIVATNKHIEHSTILQPVADKCTVIPFGLDPETFEPTPPILRLIESLEERYGDFVLFVGRLVSYKGLTHLIDAARDITNHVVIIGDGPLAEPLREQIDAAGLRDRVHLLGAVPDYDELLAYYHACKLFVLPSITPAEAFGMVLLEAMACGKPLVTSRLSSGVTHVNQHEVNGLHAEPGDVESLRTALRRILEDTDLAERLGQQGQHRFENEFTIATMISSLENAYASVQPIPRMRSYARTIPAT